jgi:hypothetical protein
MYGIINNFNFDRQAVVDRSIAQLPLCLINRKAYQTTWLFPIALIVP